MRRVITLQLSGHLFFLVLLLPTTHGRASPSYPPLIHTLFLDITVLSRVCVGCKYAYAKPCSDELQSFCLIVLTIIYHPCGHLIIKL